MKELYTKPSMEVEEFSPVSVMTASQTDNEQPVTPIGEDED